eukprot:scaffold48305_cov53-Attheya_sp.AAC.1
MLVLHLLLYLGRRAPHWTIRPALGPPARDGSKERRFNSFSQTSNDERGRRTRPTTHRERSNSGGRSVMAENGRRVGVPFIIIVSVRLLRGTSYRYYCS